MSIASRVLGPLLVAGSCVVGFGTAQAQAYPDRPIRMIVANTPGTVADTLGRLMAAEMSKSLGQPIVVEARFLADVARKIGLEPQ